MRISPIWVVVAATLEFACGGDEGEPAQESGGGAGGASSFASLYPLAEGNSWTYQVTADESCPDQGGAMTRVAVGPTEFEGKSAFEVTHSFCTDETETLCWDDGELFAFTDEWTTYLAAPLDEATMWQGPGGLHTYSYEVQVTVPAGAYSACWRRFSDSDSLSLTFCPGVGIVRASRPGYLAELLTFDF